jgi:hypothetical protein
MDFAEGHVEGLFHITLRMALVATPNKIHDIVPRRTRVFADATDQDGDSARFDLASLGAIIYTRVI